jgi:hypothetical protein
MAMDNLTVKLDFLLRVARCSVEQVHSSPVLIMYSLEARLRPRFFLVQQLGGRARELAISTVMQRSDKLFLLLLDDTSADGWSVEGYHAHIASPAFRAWADAREAELLAQHRSRAQA